jgi:hypothetical protein
MHDPGLHLRLGSRRIAPVSRSDGGYVFVLPRPGRRPLRLVSASSVPAELGINGDGRRLGFCLTDLRLHWGGGGRAISPAAADLYDGFHDSEPGPQRWTNGDAHLPLPPDARAAEQVVVTVGGFGLPFYGRQDAAAAADRRLALGFESIGEGCDLGFVQQHVGADPMSLLRWAGIGHEKLAVALECRFDGLGDPAFTELAWRDDVGEYRLSDRRYLSAHTFQGERRHTPEEEEGLRLRGCARWRLMRRKLLDDIARDARCFVFATADPTFGAAARARVLAAFRAIGPAPLLYVVPATRLEEVGTVRPAAGRHAVAQIDRLVLAEGPYDMWLHLLRQADALFRGPA